MKTIELGELILLRLHELAEERGHGEFFSLDDIAKEFGVEDRARVFSVAQLLEERGLIRGAHTMQGANGKITGEGSVLVEEGGTTGVMARFRKDPHTFASAEHPDNAQSLPSADHSELEELLQLASSLLEAALNERREQFPRLIGRLVAEAGKSGSVFSSGLVAAVQTAARAELRQRADIILAIWQRVLDAASAPFQEQEIQNIQQRARERLSLEQADVEAGADIAPLRKVTQTPICLNDLVVSQAGRLGAELGLATRVRHLRPAGRPRPQSSEVFVVHGHDEAVKEAVARFLDKLGLKPVILHERPDQGLVLLEKFERYADVGFAVVLLTHDDWGRAKNATQEERRARQNVIFEMGFFFGRLGRGHVAVIYDGVDIPSDLSGFVYIRWDGGGWRQRLVRELKAAGYGLNLERGLDLS